MQQVDFKWLEYEHKSLVQKTQLTQKALFEKS